MSITGSIVVYVIIWWIVFFSVLPIGIQSKNEEFKETIRGSDPGAPIKKPKLQKGFNNYYNYFIDIYCDILSCKHQPYKFEGIFKLMYGLSICSYQLLKDLPSEAKLSHIN